MPGRPRKVVDISTGKIGKDKRKSRKEQEGKLKVGREDLEHGAPAWLSDEAAFEFNRVVREAGKINLLDNLDLAILAIYADCYGRYCEAVAKMQEYGMTIATKHGEKPSPYVSISDKAATQIMKCSTKLGLAVTDRLRLIVPTKEEEKGINKFLKHLEGS